MAHPVCRRPPSSVQVLDADEEVFLLYTDLQRSSSVSTDLGGLGQVDSLQDTLNIQIEIDSPSPPSHSKTRPKKALVKSKTQKKIISVELAQDKTALRTRKGDTGSVLWRVSLAFAKLILQQLELNDTDGLFDCAALRECRVVELGAGTGLLGVLLSNRVKHYTITDIDALLPLIRKNVALNPHLVASNNLTVASLDWEELRNAPSYLRQKYLPFSATSSPDLIIAADCLYHPSLIPPFVATLNILGAPQSHSTEGVDGSKPSTKPLVLILAQLRETEVMREFLEAWLEGDLWEIWRLGDELSILGRGYVAWLGWRK